nr:dynactin subunit 6-like isoform X1 [Rhipicephalus microplus]
MLQSEAARLFIPLRTLLLKLGPIIIGDNNLIEEQVYIVNRRKEGDPPDSEIVMTIGNNNVFEVGSCILLCPIKLKWDLLFLCSPLPLFYDRFAKFHNIQDKVEVALHKELFLTTKGVPLTIFYSDSEALVIGNNNVLESKSKLGRYTELTSGCVIGAMCDVSTHEKLKENTVIYGRTCERRIQNEKPATQTLQLDFLTKVLPNYHYFWKPSKGEQVLQQLKK